MNMTELKTTLEKLAEKTIAADNEDFCVEDYAGGNIDDAYSLGVNAGEALLARALLTQFFSA